MKLSAKTRYVVTAAIATIVITIAGGVLNRALTYMKAPPAKAEARIPTVAVTTLVANRREYRERLIGYGRARPVTISEISAGVSGDVVWLSPQLQPGNQIEAGTELVRIDDRDLQAAVATANARLAQAEFLLRQSEISLDNLGKLKRISERELETSQRSHDRREELRRSSSISNEDFDMSLLQFAQRQRALLELQQQEELAAPEIERANAEVAAAEAALAQAQADLDRSVVKAPYSGFVDERMVHLGVRVASGTALFRMVDISRIEVPIALPASQYPHVGVGSPANIRLHETGPVIWSGVIDRVAPRINEQDRTFVVYLTIEAVDGDQPVPAGAFVVAEVEAAVHRDVIVIPRTALIGQEVYVAQPEPGQERIATIEGRTPAIEALLTDVALLSGGITERERIVVTNVEKIGHGSRVVMVDRAISEPAATE